MNARGRKPITINPRENMTLKARAAIETYASIKCAELYLFTRLVKYVLEAERMQRIQLYTWLEDRDYVWIAKYRAWKQKRESNGKES